MDSYAIFYGVRIRGQNVPIQCRMYCVVDSFTFSTRVILFQVEMAHKLTSALFKDENKKSKGQQMYMNRAQNAGILLISLISLVLLVLLNVEL